MARPLRICPRWRSICRSTFLKGKVSAPGTLTLGPDQRAARLSAYSSIDVSEAAQGIETYVEYCRRRSSTQRMRTSQPMLLGEFKPVIAYFVAVEINEQFARPLGYAPIGQILLTIEHIDDSPGRTVVDTEWVRANPSTTAGLNRSSERTVKAAEMLACALWNFPDIDTARKAFSVYSVTTVKENGFAHMMRMSPTTLQPEWARLARRSCSRVGDISATVSHHGAPCSRHLFCWPVHIY
jgi:hypothetical protein